MTGYAHQTCDTRVFCPHLLESRCLCCLPEVDARQKYLDPALLFVKGAKDNRIVHFVQPTIEKVVSEYRSNFDWPDTSSPAVKPYVPPKDMMRFGSKEEYTKIYGSANKPKEKEPKQARWSKGIAEQIFEK